MSAEKRCSRCNRLLPLEAFHVRRASRDNRTSACRSCVAGYGKRRSASTERLPDRTCPGCEKVRTGSQFRPDARVCQYCARTAATGDRRPAPPAATGGTHVGAFGCAALIRGDGVRGRLVKVAPLAWDGQAKPVAPDA